MNKKIKIFLAAGVILTAAAFLIPKKESPYTVPESSYTAAASVSDRIGYFASHGWEVEEICSRNITIPTDFTAAYEEYAMLQDKQGMPLREYAGKDAQIYVYEVKNYSPDNSRKLMAELLVCNDTAVASMVYSEDGGETLKMAVV